MTINPPRPVLLLATFLLMIGFAVPASAQEPTTSTSTTPSTAQEVPGIIPEPESGRPPQEAGDRGGALQLLVLGLVVLGLAIVAWRIAAAIRQSSRQPRQPGQSGQSSAP